LGFERNLTHLDGHAVPLVRNGVTQPGEEKLFIELSQACSESLHFKGFVQVVKGEGMPEFERSSHGDLYVEYNVVLPLELSTRTRRSEYIVSSFPPNSLMISLELMEAFYTTSNSHDEL